MLIKSNADLEREELDKVESERQKNLPVLTSLAAYVQNCFDDAVLHRMTTGVTDRILKSARLKLGQYDESTLKAIRERGGSELFFNITATKCESFVSWVSDVFAPVGDRPWDCTPTPIPTLPNTLAQGVLEATTARFAGTGATPEEIQQYSMDLYDEALKIQFEDAKEKCANMVRKMEDQTLEGNFQDAFTNFIEDMSTYPAAILKGPIFISKKVLSYPKDGNGNIKVEEKEIPTWACVDPFNFYPGPNARNCDEAYICEVIDYDAHALSEMRSIPGWNAKAIDEVLSGASSVMGKQLAGESEKAKYEGRDISDNGGLPTSGVRAVNFWGSVPGKMLIEWGIAKGVDDPIKYYEVNCILINNVVVRAVLNPDPLGRRPYFTSAVNKNKNSIWGQKSIPEKMEDCQLGVNGAQRNMLNNLAMSSGPQVAIDLDAIPAEHTPTSSKLWPWKVWYFNGKKTQHREPVTFFQPPSNVAELQAVSDYYEQKADDRTLIPRYVYGNENLDGAGATASGLSMLMNAATRGIKRIIKSIDRDVLRPAIEYLYTYNMINDPDPSIKGDAQVVARGALALLIREQIQIRRQEFLASTNNPTDLQIIGIEGRAALLREIAKSLDMTEDIVPSKEELQQRTEHAQQQQMMQPQQTEDPQKPQEEEEPIE